MRATILLGTLVSTLTAATALAAARAELYTIDDGDALFSKFGHAALCVVAPELPGGGVCYNYGTTDFSRPLGLGWDVVRGRAKFWVSESDLVSMLMSFTAQDRTIYRQVLPLSDEQVATLAGLLREDAAPDNREYIYSHFLDNCSTRPRDLIDSVTDGALSRSSTPSPLTYRDFAREGFAAFHWTLVPAGDLILGRWVDQDIDQFAGMFIPSVLRLETEERFNASPALVYQRQGPLDSGNVDQALRRFWLIVAGLALLTWISRWGGRFAALLLAIAGSIVWAGAVVSPWPELRVNELLLVFVPSDIFVLSSRARRYVELRLVLLIAVVFMALLGVLVQPIWPYWFLAAAVLASFWWRGRRDLLVP